MKNLWWLVLALSLGLSSCGAPESVEEAEPEPAPAATEVDEVAAVRAVAESWDPAMNAEDLDLIMALHAEDVVRLPAGEPALVGADAVREDFAATFESRDSEQSNPVSDVQVAGDWAFAYGTFEDVAEDATVSGKWVSIFEKTPDGWKYIVDMWNTNAPAEESSPSERESPELPEVSVPDDVRAVLDAWDEALVAADVDALVALYTDDARQMKAGEPTHVGIDAIRADFEVDLASRAPETSESTVHGFDVAGDWAYAWGTWEETVQGEEDSGKWLEIFRRTPDGWKIYVEIWNVGA